MKIEDFLERRIRIGTLEVTLPGGRRLKVGDGGAPHVAVTLTAASTLPRIVARPSLGVGEAYMDGRLVMERGDIRDLADLAGRNSVSTAPRRLRPLWRKWSNLVNEHNSRRAAARNVAHHYDLSLELYSAFLDADLQYSCAFFESESVTLEEAQAAKKRHIAAKLGLAPGQRVLDIGCGWGGLALTLAAETDVTVDGVTLSAEQLATARARAEALGLASRVNFSRTDFRDIVGRYDRIVSVGMFEHVGRPNYQAFFDVVADRLADDGVALIHSIGRFRGPAATDPFTAKYIFPGGYIPALSEVMPPVERAGLKIADIEILRLHYAYTLHGWYQRFQAARAEMAALYDERFCRMWEFYLAGAEMGFRYGEHMNFQLQLTKRVDVLPITRDYIEQAERALAESARRAA